jgi:hypothetical protein
MGGGWGAAGGSTARRGEPRRPGDTAPLAALAACATCGNGAAGRSRRLRRLRRHTRRPADDGGAASASAQNGAGSVAACPPPVHLRPLSPLLLLSAGLSWDSEGWAC